MRSYGQATSRKHLISKDFEKLCSAMAKLNGAQGRISSQAVVDVDIKDVSMATVKACNTVR